MQNRNVMNKKIVALFLLYLFQFFSTSCVPCNCGSASVYEKTYNGIDLQAWDTSGFQNQEVSGKVNKNAFGLTINLLFELNQMAVKEPNYEFGSFGFTSAWSCDCVVDEYINSDSIVSIKINVTNLENQEVIEVTDNFTTYNFNEEQLTISELFEIREETILSSLLDKCSKYYDLSQKGIHLSCLLVLLY